MTSFGKKRMMQHELKTFLMTSETKKAIRAASWRVLAAHFLLGGGAITLFYNMDALLAGEWDIFLSSLLLNGTLWIAIGWGSGMLVEWMDRWLPWLEVPVKRAVLSLVFTLGYALAIGFLILITYAWMRYRVGPLEALQSAGYTFPLTVVVVTIIVSLFFTGRGFFLAWKHAFKEAEEAKRVALASKYEALKNQVNPHFLFNSFNVLSNLVYKDPDLSAQFIQQLSKVYRYVLESQQQELAPLQEELKMLQAYLFLLKIRFGASLEVENTVEAAPEEAVVPLTLQMLAENAIKHNVLSRGKPLRLSLTRSNGSLVMQNNRQPKQNQQESLGVGLPNIQERYRYLCGQELQIEDQHGSFKVHIPVLRLKEAS